MFNKMFQVFNKIANVEDIASDIALINMSSASYWGRNWIDFLRCRDLI